jgi:hypothetical protein
MNNAYSFIRWENIGKNGYKISHQASPFEKQKSTSKKRKRKIKAHWSSQTNKKLKIKISLQNIPCCISLATSSSMCFQ